MIIIKKGSIQYFKLLSDNTFKQVETQIESMYKESKMFNSQTYYKAQSGEKVRIINADEDLEGYILCGCCTYESRHIFDLNGNSLCKDEKCKHGDLIEKIDTNSEGYSIKEK